MLGEKIKTLRLNINLTQSELGELVGVEQNTIAYYESGKLTPPAKRLLKLAAALEVQPVELYNCLGTEAESTPVPA